MRERDDRSSFFHLRAGYKLSALAVLCALITFVAYFPAVHYGFVNWDDYSYITANPHLKEGWLSVFSWAFLDGTYASLWMPLTWFSHALDYRLWGENPLGHHLTSILLHSLCAGLCVFLFYEVISLYRSRKGEYGAGSILPADRNGACLAAAFGALFFSLHPLRVESVAWISERKDVLCGLMYVLAAISYIRYIVKREEGSGGFTWYFCAIFFFILSAAAKPMAVSFPATLVILDFALRRFSPKAMRLRVVLEKLPFVTIGAGIVVLTIYLNQATSAIIPFEDLTGTQRIALVLKGYVFYLEKTLWPSSLSPYYPINMLGSGAFPLIEALVLVSLVSLAAIKGKRHLFIPATIAFFIISLLPVIGVLKVGNPIFSADRFTYIPSLGPSVLLGSLPLLIPPRQGCRRLAYLACFSVILALLVCTRGVMPTWESTLSLWTRAAQSPNNRSATIFLKRGVEYYRLHRYDDALKDFERASALKPSENEIFKWRAKTYAETGRYALAVQDINRFLKQEPRDTDALNTLGGVLLLLNRPDKAIQQYQAALEADPANWMSYYNLVNIYQAQGRSKDLCQLIKEGLDLGTVGMEDVLKNPSLNQAWQRGCD